MYILQDDRRPTKVTLTNVGSQKATFCVVHQASRQWWGQPDGFDAGLPDWLDAFPLHGCVAPQVQLPPCFLSSCKLMLATLESSGNNGTSAMLCCYMHWCIMHVLTKGSYFLLQLSLVMGVAFVCWDDVTIVFLPSMPLP